MKPILVGLSNPYSRFPEHALVPYPERSAGHRLYKMFEDVYAVKQCQPFYAASFDRRNLCSTQEQAEGLKRDHKVLAQEIAQTIPPGSTVILLGRDVLKAFTTEERPLKPTLIHPQVYDGITWRWLPHPSGRVTQYNDPVFRMLAGMTLADVLPL